jgi:hypothetical protein
VTRFLPFDQTIQPLGPIMPVPEIADPMVEQVVSNLWTYAASRPTMRAAFSFFAVNADQQRRVLKTEEEEGWASELTEKVIAALDCMALACGKICGEVTV